MNSRASERVQRFTNDRLPLSRETGLKPNLAVADIVVGEGRTLDELQPMRFGEETYNDGTVTIAEMAHQLDMAGDGRTLTSSTTAMSDASTPS